MGNATGMSSDRRLGNDDDTERAETVDQLREIALIRLRQAVS